MTDWNTIDDYFANRLTADERSRFDAALRTDPTLAEDVAFYLSAKQAGRDVAHEQRWTELLARPRPAKQTSWPFALAAAACLALLLGIGWVVWLDKPASSELAEEYITDHFSELSVTMGAGTDSLQRGLDLANQGQLTQADAVLSDLLRKQPGNADALKYAGLVSLRLRQYDQAIRRFDQLSRRTDLYANPGTFYHALARLKRDAPNDKKEAKALLQTVIDQNLDGAADARQLLDQL